MGENTLGIVSCPWADARSEFSVLRLHNQRRTDGRPEVDKGVVLGATHADVNIYSMFIAYGQARTTLLTAPGCIIPDHHILVASESIQVPRRVKLDARDGFHRDGGEKRSESSDSEHVVKKCGTVIREMYRWAAGGGGGRRCGLK